MKQHLKAEIFKVCFQNEKEALAKASFMFYKCR